MAQRPHIGQSVTLRWRKWDGTPHWEHDCVYLGSDEWGDWIGQHRGARTERPGHVDTDYGPVVVLIAPTGDHAATFYTPQSHDDFGVYVDIAWDLHWDDTDVTGIDMDLDVIRLRDGSRTWIDDEDEWREHRVRMGYPPHIVTQLETTAQRIRAAVAEASAPYDTHTASRWMDALAADRDARRDDGAEHDAQMGPRRLEE